MQMNILEIAEKLKQGLVTKDDKLVTEAEKLFREMASTEDGRTEIAETIAIYIDRNWNKFDITPYICKTKNFKLGDRPEFKLKKKGIKAYWIAPNSSTPKSRNYQEVLSMEFDNISVRPECALDDLKSGRVESFADLIKDAEEAVRDSIVLKVYTILGQVYNEASNKTLYAKNSSKLTQASLDKAIAQIRYNTGTNPTVIGDAMVVNDIAEFKGYTNEANEEIRKTGKIGVYKGANIMYLPDTNVEALGVSLFPKDRIYVVSKTIGFAGTYGDSKSGQESSIEDWSWNMRLDKEWGMTVTDPNGLYVIEIA